MQQVVLNLLLDAGGREIARVLAGLVATALLGLLMAAFVSLVLLAQVLGPPAGAPSSAPSAVGALPRPITVTGSVDGPPSTLPGPGVLPMGADSRVVDVARRYLGVPYVFGGTDPARGLDCSGLVQLVFRQLGRALPRTAQQQYDATTRVSRDELRPGDLVFFARTYDDPHDWITHVGIYIGGGQQINAPTEGQVVSIQPVFTGFWGSHFVAGGRV